MNDDAVESQTPTLAAPIGEPGFAVCTTGVEPLLKRELLALGATEVIEGRGGVNFRANLEGFYRACLWSRTASRILKNLCWFECKDAAGLYGAAIEIAWEQLFSVDAAFRVDVSGQAPGLEHSGFAALKLKDAIADRFRAQTGRRPDVAREHPDVVVHLHLDARRSSINLDLCGAPLHERGWRLAQAAAPLKETLAAALLLRTDWPAIAARGGQVLDPCCGGATLLIEALWMAADVAPGLYRPHYSLSGLSDFDAGLWRQLREEAQRRAETGLRETKVRAFGSDSDARMLDHARRNASSAGVDHLLTLAKRDVAELQAIPGEPGLLICNPPYGERLGDPRSLLPLYRQLGQVMRSHFGQWTCAVYSGNDELIEAIDLPVRKRHLLMNGPLRCSLVQLDAARVRFAAPKLTPGAQILRNRLDKNRARLRSYLASQKITCYRAYDADLPEYSAAIDVYQGDDQVLRLHVQEYTAPRQIPEADQERHRRELLQVAGQSFDCPPERVYLKHRSRQRGNTQYYRLNDSGEAFIVSDAGARFEINLADFLDSGLFLDSRILRQRVRQRAAGKRFLNLFCYTGSATIQAVAGGADSSLSVDLSTTYTQWAGRNYALNRLDPRRHRVLQADAVDWLRDAREMFDLIYLDPPTFSNSKRTDTVLDIDRDQAELIELCMARLATEGQLIFCTNAQGFKLEPTLRERWRVEDWTAQTVPPDFQRPRAIHQSYCFRRSQAS